MSFLSKIFSPKQVVSKSTLNNSNVLMAGRDINLDPNLLVQLQNAKLINKLVSDKLQQCEEYICTQESSEATTILDTLLTYGLNGLNPENSDSVYLYKAMTAIIQNETELSIYRDNLIDSDLITQFDYLLDVLQDKCEDTCTTRYPQLASFCQVALLQVLFIKQSYATIETIFIQNESYRTHFLCYYQSISCYNQGQYEQALNSANLSYIEKPIEIYAFMQNMFQITVAVQKDSLEKLRISTEIGRVFFVNQYDIVKKHELFYAVTILNALVKIQSEEFECIYQSFSMEVQLDCTVNFIAGQYFLVRNDFSKATSHFETSIKADSNLETLRKLLWCKSALNEYQYILDKVSELNSIPTPVVGLYLNALKHIQPDAYEEAALRLIQENSNDLTYLAAIIFLPDQPTKLILDAIFELTKGSVSDFTQLGNFEKYVFIQLFLQYEDYLAAKEIALSIVDFECGFIDEIATMLPQNYESESLKILDFFIQYEVVTKNVLVRKIDYSYDTNAYLSALCYLKQLFDIEPSEATASNVVNLIAFTNTNAVQSDYASYLEFLSETTKPQVLIHMASAYKQLGNIAQMESLLYKALVCFDGTKDTGIVKQYLSAYFSLANIGGLPADQMPEVVMNSVVELEAEDDSPNIVVCFESEDLSDVKSPIPGIDYISSEHLLFLKLQYKSVGNSIEHNQTTYTIKSITSKYTVAFRAILGEYTKRNPSNDFIMAVPINLDGDVLAQLQAKISPSNTPQILDLYHFRTSDVGLPLDSLVGGNYNRYADAIKMLLYADEQALYAGANSERISNYASVILSLSSVVVMQSLKQLHLLSLIKEKLLIPQSLIDFVRERAAEASASNKISPGVICETEEGLKFLPRDKSILDVWTEIYETIISSEVAQVSDEERIVANVDCLSVETLSSNLKFHRCQTDCFIVAKRENAALMADDLFLRRLVHIMQIPTLNFTGLWELLPAEELKKVTLEVSKSNYLHLPKILFPDDARAVYIDNSTNSSIK